MPSYINNKEFYKAIKEYHDAHKENKKTRIPNRVGECFLQIAKNLSKKASFSGYPFVEEMISDAVFDCVRYADKFDPDRFNNPFAYFTQICWNAFIRRIKKEKKHLYSTYKYINQSEIFGLLQQSSDADESRMLQDIGYSESARENMDRFVQDFEDKLEKENLKQQQKLEEQKKAENEWNW